MYNIEKSPFRRGCYIGYASGRVFHIAPNQRGKLWGAQQQNDVPGEPAVKAFAIFAVTLRDLSAKLAALPNPFKESQP